jgi:flagellar biosynthesis protein FlhB
MSQSGEKSEKATPKKRQDERERGNFLRSQDISNALVLVCVFGMFRILAGSIGQNTGRMVEELLTLDKSAATIPLTTMAAMGVFQKALLLSAGILFPLFAVVVVATVAIQLSQTRFLFTTKTIEIKFDKINPLNGFKRIFSSKSVAELVKSIVKIAIVMLILYQEVSKNVQLAPHMLALTLPNSVDFLFRTMLSIAFKASIVLTGFAVLDIFYQWWSFENDIKMTKQEVKEELKNTEGNPQTKGRIQQKQREMSTMRMMADVPKADVVITNPTHFAVALRYQSKVDRAPVILAMGQDHLAARIKAKAQEHQIVLVENVALARALYAEGEIGKPIPAELYKGVAEVLAYVAKLKKERNGK